MKYITKIKLQNFKKFQTFEVEFDKEINILIGDNEAGKSSVLSAIDLVIRGSRHKVETIGLEYLFNTDIIEAFLKSDRHLAKLPVLTIELFLNELNNEETSGKNNSDKVKQDGLRLICQANDEYSKDIAQILSDPNCVFPFEFYDVVFSTFADQPYSGLKKHLKHILIDNSQVNGEYAMNEYVKDIYESSIKNTIEKYTHQNEYRYHKHNYKESSFKDINTRLGDYNFAIKSNSKANLATDLTIFEGNIAIDNKGKGKQSIIKTKLALNRNEIDLDVVLMEEPENHLSHGNTKQLIKEISTAKNKQIFIATHSALISSRLDLRKAILINSTAKKPLKLSNLPKDTANFFMKAPDNNILEFILSEKVILVEGDAEYILMESLFMNVTKTELSLQNIHVISVDGTSFPRYLEIAKILPIKTAVIRDNDGNYQENCVDNYSDYKLQNINVFADTNNARSTFEICMYEDNKTICEALFSPGRRTLKVQEYMIKNKANAAFELLDKRGAEIAAPKYISEAMEWIKQ